MESTHTPSSSTAPLAGPFGAMKLDERAHEPLWRQLLNQIDDLLAAGTLRQGMNLPAEREMADALGVSRITVKRCYDELRQRGMLAGRGRGGSVLQAAVSACHAMPPLGRLNDFAEEMRSLGMAATSRLVRHAVVGDRRIASLFGRPSGAQFLHVLRVREGDGLPVARELAWYDLTVAPALANWDGQSSAHAFLRGHCGLKLTHAEQTVEAVQSSPDEMQLFAVETPQPCLLFKRRTYAASDMLVEYVEGTFRGDTYAYRQQLGV